MRWIITNAQTQTRHKLALFVHDMIWGNLVCYQGQNVVDNVCTSETQAFTTIAKSISDVHPLPLSLFFLCIHIHVFTILAPSLLPCRTALTTLQGQTVRGAPMASSTATPLENHYSASFALVTTLHQPRKYTQMHEGPIISTSIYCLLQYIS